ncbi:MAG: hypothetical protein JW909_11010 [Planctomycetes bacterium]|nr:hypothetical protein [Planctomycetota bacterium]
MRLDIFTSVHSFTIIRTPIIRLPGNTDISQHDEAEIAQHAADGGCGQDGAQSPAEERKGICVAAIKGNKQDDSKNEKGEASGTGGDGVAPDHSKDPIPRVAAPAAGAAETVDTGVPFYPPGPERAHSPAINEYRQNFKKT